MYTPCFLMPWVPEEVPTILPFSCLGHSTESLHPGMPTGVLPGPMNKERPNLGAAAAEGSLGTTDRSRSEVKPTF